MNHSAPTPSLTPQQQAGLDIKTADRDRTLATVHRLEAALGAPAPGNQVAWLHDVRAALEILDEATQEEDHNAALPDSLLADIKRTQPILASRVRGVRAQYRQARDSITALRRELELHDDPEGLDFSDVRQRVAWILAALRHQRARESDLIYEAYYDAFHADLDAGPASADPPRPRSS